MKIQKLNIRGSVFNKVQFSEICDDLEDLGFDVDSVFNLICDDKEFCYVSNGFLNALRTPIQEGEWHHFFKKEDDGSFVAGKLNFDL
jgi:hypothetical protein